MAAASSPGWHRVYLTVLLAATALLYLWHITVNGMGNAFYAASAQAGSRNWEALLFGSLDAQNFITVDKPPLSQWVMGLSGRLFGFSSASMLVPEALMAVAAVALLYAAVARIAGRWAGLLAGTALAVTPVAVLMFRYNNPDAVMVLLMTAAAYCAVRALTGRGGRWMALAGAAVGLAFLAKMLEGVLVAPAIAAAYLVAAPVPWRHRLLHVAGSAGAFLAASGWFVAVTLLWPAGARPYLAGSTDDSFLNLVFGYNGFARVLGRNHSGWASSPVAPGPSVSAAAQDAASGVHHGAGFSGLGAQAPSWQRLVTGEFGFEIGWLVPAALAATVLVVVVRGRAPRTDIARAGAILFGGWLVPDAAVLTFMHGMAHPYYSLSIATPVAAMVALGGRQLWEHRESRLSRGAFAVALMTSGVLAWWILGRNSHWLPALRWVIPVVTAVAGLALLAATRRRVAAAAVLVAAVGLLAGPAAYSVATLGAAHQGGGPLVGPQRQNRGSVGHPFGSIDNPVLDEMLKRTDTTWSAAVERSSAAASLELATGTSVMAIGGFGGVDPTPTLAQFQADVAAGRIGYYVNANVLARSPAAGVRPHADIARWVAATFPPTRVGRATVYDLTAPRVTAPAGAAAPTP